MDKEKVKNRYDKALELKAREQYANTLKDELTKPEWQTKLKDISSKMDSIGSEKDYETTMNLLMALFNDVYEKIAAPGLDKFIYWINDNSKNDTSSKKLRSFLMKDYEKYNSLIDDILSAIDSLPNENEKHLFDKLISEFKTKQKTIITRFVNDTSSYENNIDSFLSDLKDEYEGISELKAISYKDIEELYNEDQKKDTKISFYVSIIENAILEGQNLRDLDEEDKNLKLWEKAQSRISSIKKCITLLQNTAIANNDDEELRMLFTRFDGEMFKIKGDVAIVLDNFIKNKWSPLQEQYEDIKDFYEDEELVFNNNDWQDYEKKIDLDNLLKKYLEVKKGNVLSSLKSISLDKIPSVINKCYNSINELNNLEEGIRTTVKQNFEEFYNQYEEKRQMLTKLVEITPDLKTKFDDIYSEESQGKYLTNIHNGIESLNEKGSLLIAMSKDNATIFETLQEMKKAKETFMQILKQSQMEAQIDWINGFGDVDTIDSSSFNPQYLKDLLEKGLITLTFEKTF